MLSVARAARSRVRIKAKLSSRIAEALDCRRNGIPRKPHHLRLIDVLGC
jgi:hypothetical protein